MSVLFMMPIWQAPSETWMQRMLEELGDDLDSIICWSTGGETLWRNRVRAISIYPRSRFQKYGYKLLHLLANTKSSYEQSVLFREVRRSDFSCVLCHYGEFATTFMRVWQKTTVPLFVHFHGYDATFDIRLDDQPDKRYFSEAYLTNILELSKRATFIANSNFTKSLLVSAGIPEDIVHVKYLGVPIPNAGKIHSNQNTLRILQLGRLVDCKSPDRTIKAFEIVREKGIDAELIVAGDGPLRITCELLKSRSPHKESIHLLGAVNSEQAQSLLASADIYTQHNIQGEISRQSESFGVSIVEAMANGLPVVGTKHGGVLETVVDQETGILVTPGDIEGQADAIIKLSRDAHLRQQYGNSGRMRVSEKFSLEIERKKLREIMRL